MIELLELPAPVPGPGDPGHRDALGPRSLSAPSPAARRGRGPGRANPDAARVRPTRRLELRFWPIPRPWSGRQLFPLLALVLVVRSFLFEPFVIPSGSMLPTLEVGDYILVNKYRYGLRLPAGTKVVSLGDRAGRRHGVLSTHLDSYYIKRVVGLPGDFVRYDNRTLFINGERVSLEAQAWEPMGSSALSKPWDP